MSWSNEDQIAEYLANPVAFVQDVFGVEPSDQQKAILRAIAPQGAKVTVKSGHGCFGKGTGIMMADGTCKPVEDIRVGDKLMGADGCSIRRVLELKRGRERMYRFTYNDETCHVFNESHYLCLVATNNKGRRKSGDKIEVSVREWLKWGCDKKRCHAIYRSKVTRFNRFNESLEVPPYILGVWLGDGTTQKPEITTGDIEIDNAFSDYIRSVGAIVKRRRNSENSWIIYGSRSHGTKLENPVSKAIRASGAGMGDVKRIPQKYLLAEYNDRLELLAGLLDTDGHLNKTGVSYDFIQKNESIARDLCWLARSVGCHATITETLKGCQTGAAGVYWRVTIGRNIDKIPTRLQRFKDRLTCNHQRLNLHFGIKSVEDIGEDDYYGFVLDGDHKFLGSDFTVLRNTGKTATLAWVAFWFLSFHRNCRMPVTAPTAHQLFDNLWPEMHLWHRRMPKEWQDCYKITSDSISITDQEKFRFGVARTARKDQPEALQGFHAQDALLFVIEEASGIPEAVFEPIEGTLSSKNCRMIMVGNPTRRDGYFFESFHKDRALFTRLTLSCLESTVAEKGYAERMKRKYGEQSTAYRVRVLGEFPLADPLAFMSFDVVDSARFRNNQNADKNAQKTAGLDVARFGDDSNALICRQSCEIYHAEEWFGKDLMFTANKAYYLWREGLFDVIYVDANGMGAGVVDRLKELGVPVVGINVSEASSPRPERFYRLRDELWGRCWDWFNERNAQFLMPSKERPNVKGVNQDIVEDLIAELTTPYYEFVGGCIKIESKEKMKARGLESPNLADALCLTFAQGFAEKTENQIRGKPMKRTVKKVCIA